MVWQANRQIADAFKAIEWLEEQGKNVFFVTNNASKVPTDIVTKMKPMGYTNPKIDRIYTTASIVAEYVKRVYPNVRKVFVVGMKSLRTTLEAAGIEVIGADQVVVPHDCEFTMDMFDTYQVDPDVGAVIYGIDMSFTH